MGRRRKRRKKPRKVKDRKALVDRDRKVCVILCTRINGCMKSCKMYARWLNRGYCVLCVEASTLATKNMLFEKALSVCSKVKELEDSVKKV